MLVSTTVIGSLGKDPELQHLQSGQVVCRFSVAGKVGYGDKEDTLWFDVSTWGKQAEACSQYLAKGRKVYVQGELTVNEWQGNDGAVRFSLRLNAQTIKFLTSKAEAEAQDTYAPAAPAPAPAPAQTPTQQQQDDLEALPW